MQVIIDCLRIIQAERPQTGKTAIIEILCNGRLSILQVVEFKELVIAETLNKHLYIPSGEHCPEFAGKDVRITSCHHYINVGLAIVVSEATLKLLDFLNFINQDIIVLGTVYLPVHIGNQILISCNEIKCCLFLVNIDNIGLGVLTLTCDEFPHHIALAHATLSCKNNQNALPEQFLQLFVVIGS